MKRTQIYLPVETHSTLLKIAREKGTTLSRLIREGVNGLIKKRYGGLTPQQKAIQGLIKLADKYRLNVSGAKLIEQIRKERDD